MGTDAFLTGESEIAVGALRRAPLSHFRWVMLALLFAATSINYLDRQILSLLKPLLDQELHWTNAQFGWVNGLFQGAYALGLLAFGRFIDRHGTRLGYAVSIAAWSLAAMGHALAGSVAGFAAWRMALGIGEGGNFPAAIATVARWFPAAERPLATSLFNAGANVGAMAAPALVPWVAVTWGWRAPFVGAGVAGLVWIGWWWWLTSWPDGRSCGVNASGMERSSPTHERFLGDESHGDGFHSTDPGADARVAAAATPTWGSLLRMRAAWGFIVAKLLTDPVWWFFLIWLPGYFHEVHHLDLKGSAPLLVSLYAGVTALSVGGGWCAGRLARAGWSVTATRKLCLAVAALAVLPIVMVREVQDPWAAVALIGLAGGAHQAWSATLYTTVADVFPRRAVATVVGMGSMAGAVGGMLFPILTGILLDRYQATGAIGTGYAILFSVCAGAYVVAFVANHLLVPRFVPAQIGGEN